MNRKEAEELTNDVLIADALLQLKAMQDLLITKGVFTQEEFVVAMEAISRKIAKSILQKAQVQGNIDEIIDSINSPSGKKKVEN
jgi:hypothetical protein